MALLVQSAHSMPPLKHIFSPLTVTVCTPDAVVTGGEVMAGVVDEVVLETAPAFISIQYSSLSKYKLTICQRDLPRERCTKEKRSLRNSQRLFECHDDHYSSQSSKCA
jgi:hypothetical protein